MALRLTRTSSQYATTGTNFGTGSFTIEFWGYPTDLLTNSNYIALSQENNILLGLNDETTSKRVAVLYFYIGDPRGPYRSNNHIAADAWYYFKFTHNIQAGGTWSIKVWNADKTEQGYGSGTTTSGARGAGTNNGWDLGRNNWGGSSEFWSGRLRNMYISSDPTESDTDSLTRMSQSTPSTLGSASHLFPLASASDTSDSVGNITLTMQGSPTTEDDPTFLTQVLKAFTYVWHVAAVVSKAVTYLWGISNSISSSFTYVWDTALGVGAAFTYVWDAAGQVARSFTYLWGLSTKVSKSLTYLWGLAGPVARSFTYLWNIFRPAPPLSVPIELLSASAEIELETASVQVEITGAAQSINL